MITIVAMRTMPRIAYSIMLPVSGEENWCCVQFAVSVTGPVTISE